MLCKGGSEFVYLFRIKTCFRLYCQCGQGEPKELLKGYQYTFGKSKRKVREEDHPKALKDFCKDFESVDQLKIEKYLEFPCCHLRKFQKSIEKLICKQLKFFYKPNVLAVYFDLKAKGPLPKPVLSELKKKYKKLVRKIKSIYKTASSDDHKMVLDWMISMESQKTIGKHN